LVPVDESARGSEHVRSRVGVILTRERRLLGGSRQYSRRSPPSVSHMLERARRIERAAQRLLPCGLYASRKRRRIMPEKKTIERAREDKREGKAPSTQAG